MAKTLDSFTIARTAEGYVLQLEDIDGEMTELYASFDQLELISEEIDRHLVEDEDAAADYDEEDDDIDEDDD